MASSTASGASSAVIDHESASAGVLHRDSQFDGSSYANYVIVRIIHYKEKTIIGQEFLVLYLSNGTENTVVRIVCHSSIRKVASSSSSEVGMDYSISQLGPDFQPDNHYLISVTTFHQSHQNPTVLDMRSICDTIREEAPLYSVLRSGRHCYWFCTASLYRIRSVYYTRFDEGKDYEKRGCFMGIKLISEKSIRSSFAAARVSLYQCTLEGDFKHHTDCVNSIRFTPDGQHIFSCSNDKTIRIWDVSTCTEVSEPLEGHLDVVYSVAISPDGRRIASSSRDKTVRIWDLETGVSATPSRLLEGHTEPVGAVEFSPDGCKVVSCSADLSVRIWNVQTGEAVGVPLLGHHKPVQSVAWSPDGGRIASGSHDHTVRVWDAQTGTLVGELSRGHNYPISSVAFSPDGRRIVSGSEDRTIRIWDSASGLALCEPLHGHKHVVSSVAFSPDGRWIISGSIDETVRIWNSVSGGKDGEVVRLDAGSMVEGVAWSPSGDRIAAACMNGQVRIWRSIMS